MGGEEVFDAGNSSGVEIVLAEPARFVSEVEGRREGRRERGRDRNDIKTKGAIIGASSLPPSLPTHLAIHACRTDRKVSM